MLEVRDPKKLQAVLSRLKRRGCSVGFVPTMGALHDGHMALVRTAKRENDFVVVSIFVNPTQFGPKEDFRRYPRPVRADRRRLRQGKVDLLFRPSVKAMYPDRAVTYVDFETLPDVRGLTEGLCGRFRPGHFRGVATVVAKLFNMVQPDRAYFGAKDYQQSAVIERMIRDLGWPIQLRRLPTVREADGLAMSSRNVYLSAAERLKARTISQTLFWIRDQIQRRARRDVVKIRQQALANLRRNISKIQYLEIVDAATLGPLTGRRPQMVAALACYVGKTRLIDNVIIRADSTTRR